MTALHALHALHPVTTAIYIVCMFMASIDSAWILIGGVGLGISLTARYLAPNKSAIPKPLLISVAVLCVGNLSAVLGAVWWGTGNWELTFSSIFWIMPAMGVMVMADERVFPWLVVFGFVHAIFIIYAELFLLGDGLTFPSGLTYNSNVAAGILVLTGIIGIYKRYPLWIPIIFLAAIAITQSRWALLLYSSVIVAGCLSGRLNWRWILGLAIVAALLLTLTDITYRGYHPIGPTLLTDAAGDITVRLSFPDWPDLLPHGLVEHRGLHNVPFRMARESGLVCGVLWVALSVWALIRGRGSVWWWLMLGVVGLSMLDYYTWRPHVGAFWFLALGGIAMKPERSGIETRGNVKIQKHLV